MSNILHLRLPDDWREAFRAAAEREGKTLTNWLLEKGVAALPKRTAAKLSERRGRGQPRKESPPAT